MRHHVRAVRGGLLGLAEWPAPPAGRELPPLVFLHGFTGDGADLAELAPRLGRRVLAPDLLGHGLSRAPAAAAPYALDRQLARLEALLDGCGLPSVTLGGYSLGARLALHLAVRRPAGVRALVLIGGTPGLADEAERAARRADDAALAARLSHGLAPFLATWRSLPLIASQERAPPALRASMRRRRARLAPHGLARTLVALSSGALPSLWDALPGLDLPTLLVTGADDAKFDAIARDMAARLPRARHVVIAGSGHAPHLERPAACAAAVRAFLG